MQKNFLTKNINKKFILSEIFSVKRKEENQKNFHTKLKFKIGKLVKRKVKNETFIAL